MIELVYVTKFAESYFLEESNDISQKLAGEPFLMRSVKEFADRSTYIVILSCFSKNIQYTWTSSVWNYIQIFKSSFFGIEFWQL